MAGYFIGLIGTQYPRRNLLTLYLGLAALCSLPVALIPPGKFESQFSMNTIAIILFASLGKMFCTTSMYIMYCYSSTIYPTNIRNTLVSYVSSFGRLGSILAPLINLLRFTVWGPLPYYIFTTTTAIACCLAAFLPNDKLISYDI